MNSFEELKKLGWEFSSETDRYTAFNKFKNGGLFEMLFICKVSTRHYKIHRGSIEPFIDMTQKEKYAVECFINDQSK